MPRERQISAFIADDVKEALDRHVETTGMKKGRVIEEALDIHLKALAEIPAQFIIHPTLVLTAESARAIRLVMRRRFPHPPPLGNGIQPIGKSVSNETYFKKIAGEIGVGEMQVRATAHLLSEGGTVPFIAPAAALIASANFSGLSVWTCMAGLSPWISGKWPLHKKIAAVTCGPLASTSPLAMRWRVARTSLADSWIAASHSASNQSWAFFQR